MTLIAEKIKSDLSKIGIELKIVQQGWGAGFGDAYREGTIGFTPMYWGPDYYDPNTQLAFLPGQYHAIYLLSGAVGRKDRSLLVELRATCSIR